MCSHCLTILAIIGIYRGLFYMADFQPPCSLVLLCLLILTPAGHQMNSEVLFTCSTGAAKGVSYCIPLSFSYLLHCWL